MVNEFKKKDIMHISETITNYGNRIAEVSEELAKIDEKYKSNIENEKKSLKEEAKNLAAEQKFWKKMLAHYDNATITEVLGIEDRKSVV